MKIPTELQDMQSPNSIGHEVYITLYINMDYI